jgi:DNA-binding CsgD family transcriptional regulator
MAVSSNQKMPKTGFSSANESESRKILDDLCRFSYWGHVMKIVQDNLLERLSDGQKDCLRLVGQYYSSKEIARQLKISSHTVDQRLKRATALLSVSSRFDAARMLANAEGSAPTDAIPEGERAYQRLVYQPPDLSPSQKLADKNASADGNVPKADMAGAMLQEMQASYLGAPIQFSGPRSFWSVLFDGKRVNDLTVTARLLVMAVILVLCLLGFAAIVSVMEGLSRLT